MAPTNARRDTPPKSRKTKDKMSKATTIDSALILPFIQATKNDQPSKGDITKYVKAENPPEAGVAQLEA